MMDLSRYRLETLRQWRVHPVPRFAPDPSGGESTIYSRMKERLTQQVRVGILVMELGCYSGTRIELAGDAVDAWKLVSPFVSEDIL